MFASVATGSPSTMTPSIATKLPKAARTAYREQGHACDPGSRPDARFTSTRGNGRAHACAFAFVCPHFSGLRHLTTTLPIAVHRPSGPVHRRRLPEEMFARLLGRRRPSAPGPPALRDPLASRWRSSSPVVGSRRRQHGPRICRPTPMTDPFFAADQHDGAAWLSQ